MPLTRVVGSYIMCPLDEPADQVSWEDFIVTTNPDGSRTAQTMSRFPGCSVVRHVTQTVAPDFTPIDGFVRLFVDNVFKGALVRRVEGDKLVSIRLPAGGEAVDLDTFDLDGPDMVLGYHPTTAEGWKLMKLDRSMAGPQTLRLFTVSMTWNGHTLDHGKKGEMSVEYMGEEDITTPAGTFACHHYVWHTGAHMDGDLQLWLTGSNSIVARMDGDRRPFRYELASYSETEFGDDYELSLHD
jgi:hypothetical protein